MPVKQGCVEKWLEDFKNCFNQKVALRMCKCNWPLWLHEQSTTITLWGRPYTDMTLQHCWNILLLHDRACCLSGVLSKMRHKVLNHCWLFLCPCNCYGHDFTWFQASATKWIRTVFFWAIVQQIVVILCWLFRTTDHYSLHNSREECIYNYYMCGLLKNYLEGYDFLTRMSLTGWATVPKIFYTAEGEAIPGARDTSQDIRI